MGFRENLKAELSYSDMLVKELASRSGVSMRTIENYLRERSSIPSAENAARIARALGVSVEYLVYGKSMPCAAAKPECLSPSTRAAARIIEGLSEKHRRFVLTMVQQVREQLEETV